jgi:hypothetical protein
MSKFHRLFENTQIHRAYFGAASAEPLEEASIAKMNRKAKAALDADAKKAGNKRYSPEKMKELKAALFNAYDYTTSFSQPGVATIQEKDGNLYLNIDYITNTHPNIEDAEGAVYHIDDGWPVVGRPTYNRGSTARYREYEVEKGDIAGFELLFRVTQAKDGKLQYDFVQGFVDAGVSSFAYKILKGAAAVVKTGSNPLESLEAFINETLDYHEMVYAVGEKEHL